MRDGAIYIYKYEKVKHTIGSEISIYHETQDMYVFKTQITQIGQESIVF